MATFANTAPAAFGSVGNPIQALAKVTSFPADDLAAMVGRQSAFVAAVVPLVLAATNGTGGVQGKAAAMQNLCLAASAVGMPGKEGDIVRKVLGWSLALLALFCLFGYLQTSALSWMVPSRRSGPRRTCGSAVDAVAPASC